MRIQVGTFEMAGKAFYDDVKTGKVGIYYQRWREEMNMINAENYARNRGGVMS